MKKLGIIGSIAAMIGELTASGSTAQKGVFNISNTTYKPKPVRQVSKKGWVRSEPSAHFGERSKPVNAYQKDGSIKLMKLKNALKKGLQYGTA